MIVIHDSVLDTEARIMDQILGGLAGVVFLIALATVGILVGAMGSDMADQDQRRKRQ